MTVDQREELDWLAFLYVSGELNGDQFAAFEVQLAEDQAAREAVAAAVELASQIYLASRPQCDSPIPIPAGAVRWSKVAANSARWFASAAAICLLLTLSFIGGRKLVEWSLAGGRVSVVAAPATDEFAPEELAAVWSETRVSALDRGTADFAADEHAWHGEVADAGRAEEDHPDAFAAPDWMLAAVSAGIAQREQEGEPDATDG